MKSRCFERHVGAAAALVGALLLGACASPPTSNAMKATLPIMAAAHKAPGGVTVSTSGGTETSVDGCRHQQRRAEGCD